ncbi:hypothetical protein CAPTEDRAFT_195295 [Capitella teleta]|uniref:Uncharacterized protein n=1 Tax=Capitella teleta TaxID=283909 RepID=R7TBZ0_CAPTE|nr:hypothetical protein CAPTEDRAFT_195295 [Capitella teleta]|eukprot:ELT88611.1 hypothetical protein CAPTEDRAFT_195295 [Capitella teleta]
MWDKHCGSMQLVRLCALLCFVVGTSVSENDVFKMTRNKAEVKMLKTIETPEMRITVKSDLTYDLYVAGQLWLKSAPSFIKANGIVYSTKDETLAFWKTEEDSGADRLGHWTSTDLIYNVGSAPVIFSFRSYPGISAVVFGLNFVNSINKTSTGSKDTILSGFPGFLIDASLAELGYLSYGMHMIGNIGRRLGRLFKLCAFQSFPSGANETSTNDKDNILSGFPAFKIDSNVADLGYLAFGFIHTGNMGRVLGRWDSRSFVIKDGRNGGPMALFDRHGNALFISPFSQFMSASVWHDKSQSAYYWGIMGSVQSVPAGFHSQTIVYYSPNGINAAIEGWGLAMRTLYNKQSHYRESDVTVNYLSYWSDNGAYYVNYYMKDSLIDNMTYEEAMLKVSANAQELGIPYRSIQYSVWFKPGRFNGNSEWSANPLLFPKGMKSPDTPYAKQNGGRYDFIVESLRSLPYDEDLWTDIFRDSQKMGFKTYMQDWMNDQFDNMNATTNNVHVARDWLIQMGLGAQRNGLTVQYCMSECRHILQSLEIPVVTQARASDDYQPNSGTQWQIGMSSMLAWAVNIAPYKDTFWTTSVQNSQYYHASEPYPAMHAVISTLSMGPVGPGDRLNHTDVQMLMKCCAQDGLILKPSKPAMSLDAQIMQSAFGDYGGPKGELWSTYSTFDHLTFGVVFATNMTNYFSVKPLDAHFGPSFSSQTNSVYTIRAGVPSIPTDFSDDKPIKVTPNCINENFCLFYSSPKLSYGNTSIFVLGETAKWVPVSPQRVTSIEADLHDLRVHLTGSPGEEVNFFYFDTSIKSHKCVLSPSGTALISYAKSKCISV